MATPQVSPAYNNNDFTNDLIGGAFGALSTGLSMFGAGGGFKGTPKPAPNVNPGWGPNSIPYAPR